MKSEIPVSRLLQRSQKEMLMSRTRGQWKVSNGMDWELAGRLNLAAMSNKLRIASEGELNIMNVLQISDFHLDRWWGLSQI